MNDYKFSTLEYKRPDLEARREKLAGWKDAVEHAQSYGALRALMLEIDRETCELATQYSIAHIRHTASSSPTIRTCASRCGTISMRRRSRCSGASGRPTW